MRTATLEQEAILAGRLEIRPHEKVVLADGRLVALTVREFDLLVELARRGGRIVGREELYERVWAQPFQSCERSVDVYVSKLRSKLERELPEWRFIHTHVGFGYRFSGEPLHPFHTPATAR